MSKNNAVVMHCKIQEGLAKKQVNFTLIRENKYFLFNVYWLSYAVFAQSISIFDPYLHIKGKSVEYCNDFKFLGIISFKMSSCWYILKKMKRNYLTDPTTLSQHHSIESGQHSST